MGPSFSEIFGSRKKVRLCAVFNTARSPAQHCISQHGLTSYSVSQRIVLASMKLSRIVDCYTLYTIYVKKK